MERMSEESAPDAGAADGTPDEASRSGDATAASGAAEGEPSEAAAAAGAAGGDESAPAPGEDADGDPEEWVPFEGLSDEGLLLLFAGLACGMAAITAVNRGQPQPIVVFGAAAGAVALVVFAVDFVSGHVPRRWVHLLVGGGASVAGAFALAGRHWVNAGTFGVAAALVLYRVLDLEFLGAEGPGDGG